MDVFLSTPHTYPSIFTQKNGGGMDVYLAGGYSRPYLFKDMDVYLALANSGGTYPHKDGKLAYRLSILESFYYIGDWMLPYIKNHWDFLLDSGAFTFFGKVGDSINWVEYTESYCKFINKHDIKKFFELDIDVVMGTPYAEDLRKRIEDLTGKQPIPVWRPMRGVDYWSHMIDNYPYIAISSSGMYDSAWTRKKGSEHVLRQMVKQAQDKGVRVHGLGYTALKHLKYIGWDSVDSTAWIMGNMSGKIYKFTGTTITNQDIPRDKRLIAKKAASHNFSEWVKFQQYAKTNL